MMGTAAFCNDGIGECVSFFTHEEKLIGAC